MGERDRPDDTGLVPDRKGMADGTGRARIAEAGLGKETGPAVVDSRRILRAEQAEDRLIACRELHALEKSASHG